MASYTTTQTEPSCSAIELQPVARDVQNPDVRSQRKLGTSDLENIREDVAPPDTAVDALQKWNSPRINMWRVSATFFSFFVFGMNDGSYGVSLSLAAHASLVLTS
jgi:hypothetical protein